MNSMRHSVDKFLPYDEEPEEDPEEDDYSASGMRVNSLAWQKLCHWRASPSPWRGSRHRSHNHYYHQDWLVDTRARSTDVERGIAGLPGQTDTTNTLALLAEGRSVETLQGVDGMQDLMPSRRLMAKHQGMKGTRKQCLRLARFHFKRHV